MAVVIISDDLKKEIFRRFKAESKTVLDLLLELEECPKKGKPVGTVGKIVIKELKYKKFRFYFVTDGFKVKFLSVERLKDLLIKVVRMSEKNDQRAAIEEIKRVLRKLGDEGF